MIEDYSTFDIIILTEAGGTKGFGHLSRCSALRSAFDELGLSVTILLDSDDIKESKIKSHCQIFDWKKDIDYVLTKISKLTIIVIDSYECNEAFYFKLFNQHVRLVILDDNSRLAYPDCVVFNPTTFTNYLTFPNISDKYILGSEYVMMRKSFWDAKINDVKESVEHIFIMIGGSDPLEMTEESINEVVKVYPNSRISVVASDKNGLYSKYSKEPFLIRFFSNLGEYEVKELISTSDLAVVAAGQVVYELMRLGCPSIPLGLFDNQTKFIQSLVDLGYVTKDIVMDVNYKSLSQNLFEELEMMKSKTIRKKNSELGVSLIDGQGARKSAKAILNKIETL